jgi:carboxylesterase type B
MGLTAALFIVGLLGQAIAHRDKQLTVNTTSGLYTGFVDQAVPDVNQWLGIRYGKAPLGAKRFLPPEAAENDGLHRYARDYPTLCFQQSGDHTGLFWELVPEFQNQDPQGEDCLFLNVWAPRKPVTKNVPVIIWACGGGLQEGGGHAPYQVPDHWIQRMQTHIVITFKWVL